MAQPTFQRAYIQAEICKSQNRNIPSFAENMKQLCKVYLTQEQSIDIQLQEQKEILQGADLGSIGLRFCVSVKQNCLK